MENQKCGCERCRHISCTKKVPIFLALDEAESSRVADLILRRSYSKGELILMEGDKLDSLIIINTGRAKAFSYTPEGKEQILYIFSEGDFFGERNLLKSQESTYSIEALEETRVCMIQKNDFEKLLVEYPGIGLKIIEELSARLERLESAIKSMGTKTVEARVNAILLEFARKYGIEYKDGILVELPLSREGIANYIGLARETVSRKLSLLQDEGIIDVIGNKKIVIRNKSTLEELV